MPDTAKPYVRREARMLYEWIQKFHPTKLQWIQQRLGPLPQSSQAYNSLRRYADAIIIDKNVVYIIEASIRPEHEKIAQLELYDSMFPDTPEFSTVKDLPRKLVYLTTLEDVYVRQLAQARNIDYVIYSPSWVKEYWREVIAGRK